MIVMLKWRKLIGMNKIFSIFLEMRSCPSIFSELLTPNPQKINK
jgi:hypothetical protein